MSPDTFAKLDIAEHWGRLNDTIIDLVDYIPENKLDWSPQDDLWDFHHVLSHLVFTRHGWMGNSLTQKIKPEEIHEAMATRAGSQEALRRSWARVRRFLSDEGSLNRLFEGEAEGQSFSHRGHWIAFHLLEHDIHHRSDLFHYLALLKIEHPDVGTP